MEIRFLANEGIAQTIHPDKRSFSRNDRQNLTVCQLLIPTRLSQTSLKEITVVTCKEFIQ